MTKLARIFEIQTGLSKVFWEIEKQNKLGFGITDGIPFDIDCPVWQSALRDQAWRITEEVIECKYAPAGDKQIGEAMDVLHFTVELFIKLDMMPNYEYIGKSSRSDCRLQDVHAFAHSVTSVNQTCTKIIDQLAMGMNYLKNRPWKQSSRITNIDEFLNHMDFVFMLVIQLAKVIGLSVDDICREYARKAANNKHRQDTGV